MSQPIQLFNLQQVDSQLDQSRTRLKEIEIALSDDKVVEWDNRAAALSAARDADPGLATRAMEFPNAPLGAQLRAILLEQRADGRPVLGLRVVQHRLEALDGNAGL